MKLCCKTLSLVLALLLPAAMLAGDTKKDDPAPPAKGHARFDPLIVTPKAVAVGQFSIKKFRAAVDKNAWKALMKDIEALPTEEVNAKYLAEYGNDINISVAQPGQKGEATMLFVVNFSKPTALTDLIKKKLPEAKKHQGKEYFAIQGLAFCMASGTQLAAGDEPRLKGYLDRLQSRKAAKLAPELQKAEETVEASKIAWLAMALPPDTGKEMFGGLEMFLGDLAKPLADLSNVALAFDLKHFTVNLGFHKEESAAALNKEVKKVIKEGKDELKKVEKGKNSVADQAAAKTLEGVKVKLAGKNFRVDIDLPPITEELIKSAAEKTMMPAETPKARKQ